MPQKYITVLVNRQSVGLPHQGKKPQKSENPGHDRKTESTFQKISRHNTLSLNPLQQTEKISLAKSPAL
jgi:hypothetical protein